MLYSMISDALTSDIWNMRVKTYPNGDLQYFFFANGVFGKRPKKEAKYAHLDEKTDLEKQLEAQRISLSRTIQKVYDYAKSNKWDYFTTFTFNPDKVNSFDYDECVDALYEFTHRMSNYSRNRWIIVPELHKSGAYHFHGLVRGELKLTRATNAHTGQPLRDNKGRAIYNIGNYRWGYTTATKVGDNDRVANYLVKYFTKQQRLDRGQDQETRRVDLIIPEGRKRYWASRNLETPREDFYTYTLREFDLILQKARYIKSISREIGGYECQYYLCEV